MKSSFVRLLVLFSLLGLGYAADVTFGNKRTVNFPSVNGAVKLTPDFGDISGYPSAGRLVASPPDPTYYKSFSIKFGTYSLELDLHVDENSQGDKIYLVQNGKTDPAKSIKQFEATEGSVKLIYADNTDETVADGKIAFVNSKLRVKIGIGAPDSFKLVWKDPKTGGMMLYIIIGSVLGVVLLLAVIGGVVGFIFYKRRKNAKATRAKAMTVTNVEARGATTEVFTVGGNEGNKSVMGDAGKSEKPVVD